MLFSRCIFVEGSSTGSLVESSWPEKQAEDARRFLLNVHHQLCKVKFHYSTGVGPVATALGSQCHMP